MPRKVRHNTDQTIPLTFPLLGVDEVRAFGSQRSGTCADAQNVRGFDPKTGRARGGQRSGLSKFFSGQAVGSYPIQDINHLVTNDASEVPDEYGHLIFGRDDGAGTGGFGIADGDDGATIATQDLLGFKFACSCWDEAGYVYVAMVNTTNGAVALYKKDVAGVNATTPIDANFTVKTGSLRSLAGMTVCQGFLYIAVTKQDDTAAIHKVRTDNLNTAFLNWQVTNLVTAAMLWSSNSVNCLASIGTTIGAACKGSIATNHGFRTYSVVTGQQLTFTNHVGTQDSTTFTKVVSDGVAYFYMIPCVTPATILKYGLGGVLVSAFSGTTACNGNAPRDLTYDHTSNKLVLVTTATPSLRSLSLTSGATIASSDPGSLTAWHAIDCDSQGAFTVWRNSVGTSTVTITIASPGVVSWTAHGLVNGDAVILTTTGALPTGLTASTVYFVVNKTADTFQLSATSGGSAINTTGSQSGVHTASGVDAMGLNSTFSTLWGPKYFSSTTHAGASVNKGGSQVTTPIAATRQTRPLVVSNGEVRLFGTYGTTSVVSGQSINSSVPVVFSAQNGLDMFYVDGVNRVYYKGTTNAMTTWTPTAGELPSDTKTTFARLICTWRGRTVLSGLVRDPQNWFMSRQGDPFNWDYDEAESSTTPLETRAVAGNTSLAGLTGDFINCLIPHTDDEMIFGCDHSIWKMAGDPAFGGDLHLVTDTIGMCWGRPFAKDPYGQIYFVSNQCGIYKMSVGAVPVRISQQIDERLEALNTGNYIVRLAWDTRIQGLAVFFTPRNDLGLALAQSETENYFWEARTNAWWPDFYSNPKMNPFAVHVMDDDSSTGRVLLIGGQDGYVRYSNINADDDDGETIESFVLIGPLVTPEVDELKLKTLQAIMATGSSEVRYDIFVGPTAEEALAPETPPVESGTWQAGRNDVTPINEAGHAVYVQISGIDQWAMEAIIAIYSSQGKVRARRYG